MQRHLHTLRQKPEHVRRNIAVGASFAITALVAVVWVTTLAQSGALALAPYNAESGVASTSGSVSATLAQTGSSFNQLLGAVGAASSNQNGSSSEPTITVVDGKTTSTLDTKSTQASEATVLTF